MITLVLQLFAKILDDKRNSSPKSRQVRNSFNIRLHPLDGPPARLHGKSLKRLCVACIVLDGIEYDVRKLVAFSEPRLRAESIKDQKK